MSKEEIKSKIDDILTTNYNKFQGTNEAEIHSCFEITELFDELTKELQQQLDKYKTIAESESVRADNLQEQYDQLNNGMLELIKYKNELAEQLSQKVFELQASDHTLAEKEKELSGITDFIDDINYMRKLYANQKYSQAERERDKLAEKLDDIMRINPTN